MTTLIIDSQGASLSFRQNRFIVASGSEELMNISLHSVSRIHTHGNISLRNSAVKAALQNQIPVHFSTQYGHYHGTLHPAGNKNVFLRIKQAQLVASQEFCTTIATQLVQRKIANQRQLLQRHHKQYTIPELMQAQIRMGGIAKALRNPASLATVRGIEGICSKIYFDNFQHLLRNPALTFTTRTRRPARDPINAMLNLGYTILMTEIASALRDHGLDPDIGYLHQPAYGRPSLACDIIEPFRGSIDELVVRTINRRQIGTSDFRTDAAGTHMYDNGRRKYLALIEELLSTDDIRRPALRKRIQQQCTELVRMISGDQADPTLPESA